MSDKDQAKAAEAAEKKTKASRKKADEKVLTGADAVVQAAVSGANQVLAQQAQEAALDPTAPVVVLHQHFLNDLSVENPAGVLDARASEAKLGQAGRVEVSARAGDPASFQPGEPTHQVTVGLRLTADLDGKTIYLAEMGYRALVEVRNLEAEQVEPALFVMIPEAMFPALKEVMERTGGYAGYPALTIQPIDFAAIYAQSKNNQAAAAEAAGKTKH